MTHDADPDPLPDLPDLLSFGEVAARLRISRGAIYRLAAAGELEVVDLGAGRVRRLPRVVAASVDALLARRRIRPAPLLAAQEFRTPLQATPSGLAAGGKISRRRRTP